MDREPLRRRRAALSCLTCRRRKIKCNRENPCAHCKTTKAQCEYKTYHRNPSRSPQHRPVSRTAGSNRQAVDVPPARVLADDVLDQHDTPEVWPRHGDLRGFQSESAALPVTESQSPTAVASTGPSSVSSPVHRGRNIWDLVQRAQPTEELASTFSPAQGLSESNRDILARHTGLRQSQIMLNKTRILGWSHWLGMAREFQEIVTFFKEAVGGGSSDASAFKDPDTKALVDEAGVLLQKCKALAKGIKTTRPGRCLSVVSEIGLPPLRRDVAGVMVAHYFRSFESTHRILHIPTFWAEYEGYWAGPNSAPNGLRHKVLLVVAVGSSVHVCASQPDAEFRQRVHRWIHAAQTWLSGPLGKDRLDITGIQVFCLLILARQIFSVGGDLIWMSTGSLIHMAMQIGLHRDPKHLPPMSVLEAEVRRRLWATILELAVQSSLDSAMPPRISFDEFDTDPPSNIDDADLSDSITVSSPLNPHPRSTCTQTSMQLLLLDSLRTRLRVVQQLNDLHSELYYADALAITPEINDACRVCSEFAEQHRDDGVTPFHRNMLDYLLRRFLLPLHAPFASQARTNPLFYYSRKVNHDAAMAILSPEPDEDFSRLMKLGGGLIREGIRCALTVICLELLAQVDTQRQDGTLRRNAGEREELKAALRGTVTLSADRIRSGETNIKLHMFVSAVLAQADAVEQDLPCEYNIAKSARDSLEFCHGLLESQAGAELLLAGQGAEDAVGYDAGIEDGFELDIDLDYFFPGADFSGQ